MVIPSIDKPITKATQRALDELDNKIKQEKTRALAKESDISDSLNTERSTRQSIDESLQSQIDREQELREYNDTNLSNQINDEIANRTNADAEIRSWAQQQITEKIDNSLYKIEFTIPATIWKQGVLGIRYLPKITFGDNISFDAGTLLILRSNDPKFIEHEVRLVGQGNENGCGYILIDCDYYSKAEPSFPDTGIDCVLYVITLTTKTTTKTNGYVEVSDEAWLDPSYIPATENVNTTVTQNGSTLEVE